MRAMGEVLSMRGTASALVLALATFCSGARADETAAIQARIDAASSAGGGVVTVAPGDHHVASLELKSNVTLELAKGARLVASTNYLDYATVEKVSRAILWATNAVNVAVLSKFSVQKKLFSVH